MMQFNPQDYIVVQHATGLVLHCINHICTAIAKAKPPISMRTYEAKLISKGAKL